MRLRLPILFLLLLFFQLFSTFAFAQTVCVAPYNPTPATSWGMVQKFQSNALIWNGGTPTAADLNGDGISEILAPDENFTGYYVYKGDGTNKTTATKDFVIATASGRSVQPAIANIIGNASSAPEVVMVNTAGFVYVFASTGGTETNFLFKSTTASQYTNTVTPYIVDIDEDGTAEIVLGSDVFGIVGNTLVKRVTGPALGYIGATSGNTGTPVDVIVADILSSNPGKELIYGSRVYGINLATGVTTILKDLSTIVGTSLIAANDNGPTAIADMNGDGKLDIVYNGSSFVVMWDPNGTSAANTLLFRRMPPSFIYGVRGLPLIANVFDDKTTGGKSTDLPEAVIINSSGGSSGIVTAYNLNYNTTAGTATQHIWSLATNDMSGCTGITAFDFDGNGLREIVYRDQSTLRIINGNRTTPVNYATANVASSTWGEYPIVADLNNDGQAEIAVTGNSMLQVFGSDPATFPWKGAPTYWNQRNYRIVNINSNLTIPATEVNAASSIAYNNNAAQFQFADAVGNGVPSGFTYAPDARITINTVTTDCPRITVTATISNSGSFVLPAGTSVAMYDANPTTGAANLIGTFQTTASIAAGASQSVTMTANLVSLSTTVFAVVNDRGTTTRPFNLSTWTPNTGINECTYTNNIDSKSFTCIDSDGDSVVDFIDIDDDNDGVLDTSEQSGSCSTVTLTPFSATSSPVYGGSTATRTIDGSGFTGTGLAALATAPATLSDAWLLKEPETSGFIEYLMPAGSNVGGVALWAPDANNYGGGDGPPKDFRVEVTYEGGRIFTSQVFTTAQPNSDGALPGAQAFYFPKAFSNVTKLRLNILNGWYDINNNSVGQVSTDGIAVNAAYNMFLGEFRAICGVADLDTDNDGIPNRLDLDSDGDGCTDAIEAGVSGTLNSGAVKNGANGAVTSTTTTPNAIAAGIYGANGFANSLETATDNGVINYTSTYAYAMLRGYAACVDSDNDSINDVLDVDDDNDGVLDLTELSCTSPLNVEVPTITGATSIFSDNNTANFIKFGGSTLSKISTTLYETSIDVVQFAGTSSGSIVLNTTYQQLKIVVADLDQSESVTLKVYDVLGNLIPLSSSNILQKGSYVNPTYPAGSSMVLTSAGALDYDGSTNAISNILIEIPFAAKRIEIYKTAGSNNTWVGLFAGCNDQDTDNDSTPNRLDLDSDGDGCSDALESGATTSTTANFAFTGTMGANGLDDSLESAGNGLINYTSTYDFANSKNYAACIDTDGDSITDVIDLDDDNDGVVDAVESPTCFYSKEDWLSGNRSDITVSTTLAMNATYGSPYKLVDGDNGTAAANYAVNFIASTTAGQTVYAFKMPVPVELKTIYLGYINANTHFNTGTVLRLEGSNDNVSWTTLGNGYGASTSVPGLAGSLTANTFSVTQNSGKYLFYRIYWVSGGGVNATAYSNEVYFETYSTYQPSLYPKLDCISDSDGDGIPNHQDLDSDGDGCPDAREAGVLGTLNAGTIRNKVNGVLTTTANVANSIASGVYGLNGFADAIETASESGLYSGLYLYEFATANSINVCLDTDGDAVPDLMDIDDDNDGILDAIESPTCFFTAEEIGKPIAISSELAPYSNYVIDNAIDASLTSTAAFNPNVNWVNKEIFKLTALRAIPIAGIKFDLSTWAISNGTGNTFKLQGSNSNTSWTDLSVASSSTATTGSYQLSNTISPTTKYKFYRVIGVAGSSYYGGVTDIQFVLHSSYAASQYPKLSCTQTGLDADSTPNHLDLDSDGDGCSDALEAGTTTNNTANFKFTSNTNTVDFGANGFFNTLERTAAESNVYASVYTYDYANDATFKACTDTDTDGITDIIDIDDDNDGVLDAIESPTCFYTLEELIAPAAVTSELTQYTTSYVIGNSIDGVGTTASAFTPNQDWVGKEIFKFTAKSYIAISGMSFDLVSWALSSAAASTFKLQGSGDNLTWTDLSTATFSSATTGTFTISNTLATTSKFKYFRILGVAGLGSYGGVYEARFNLAASTSSSANPKPSCSTGITDGDLIPNHLDLDSDGDGCSDAFEAGTTSSATANFVHTTTMGANGFADALQTTGNGIYNGVYTYYYANNAVFNACADTDTDGVKDIIDVDDDNDGILDAVESPTCFTSALEASIPVTLTSELAIYNNNIPSGALDNNASTFSAFNPSINWVNKEIFRITPNVVGPLVISGVKMDLYNWAISNGTSNTFKLQGSLDNGATWVDLSAAVSSTLTTGSFTVSNTLNPTVGYSLFRITGVAGVSYYGGVTELSLVLPASYQASKFPKASCTRDTDNDSKFNHQDLDSDGDGCSDAKEAGLASNTTSSVGVLAGPYGLNGFVDALETTTDNGVYRGTYVYKFAISASENACLDTDSDGLGDLLDIDDDNDGVLDLVEQSCANAVLSKSGITISSTVNWVFQNAPTGLNSLLDGNLIQQIYPSETNLNNKTILQFNLPSQKVLNLIELANNNNQTPLIAGGTYKIQGSNDGGATWVDIVASQVVANSSPILATTNSIKFDMSQNVSAFSTYRILGISITGQANWSQEVYFRESVCTNIDTDNDGTPNHLDLDSDGDGCSDAIEAGSSTTATSTTLFATTSGTTDTNSNGLLNVYEVGTTGTVNYTSTYSIYALVRTVNACTDTDSDGVKDLVDLDDDNDGVLDSIENGPFGCVQSPACVTNASLSATTSATGTPPTGWTNFANGGSVDINQGSWVNSYGPQATLSSVLFPASNASTFFIYGMSKGGSGTLGGWGPYGEAFQQTLNCLTVGQTYYLSFRGAFTHSQGIANAVSYETTPTAARFVLLRDGTQVSQAPDQLLQATQQLVTLSFVATATTHTIAIAHTADLATDLSLMVIEAGSGYLCTSNPASFNEALDTDGDGIPNRLDLDSDGDGCSDAVEAKTVTSLTATTVSGGFGTNGFADNLETSGNGVYTGTYVYSRATDPTVKACLDSDFDGVPDIDDLDDDNDGILDTAECSATIMIENNTANLGQVSRKSWTLAYVIEQDVNSFAGGVFGALRAEATQNVYGEVKLPPASTPVIKEAITTLNIPSADFGTVVYREVFVKIPATTAFTSATQISFRVGKDNLTWNSANLYVAHTGASITATTPVGGGGGSTSVLVSTNSTDMKLVSQGKFNGTGGPYYQGGAFVTSPTNAGKWVRMALSIQDGAQSEQASVQYSLNGSTWLPVDVANGFQFAATEFSNSLDSNNLVCDVDGDGIPNTLDLDSDGDGCSDANEAYNSASTQGTDGNQVFGTNPITVDATGKVTGANYTSLNSNFLSVGSASVVTVQPTDQTTIPGGQAIFASTVTAGSGTTTYQWQLSTDGGTNWSNVANSSTYAGATTSTLTVSNVTVAMRGYRYRLQLSQSNYVCGNVTSAVAKIAMNNTPSIVDDEKTGPEDTPVTGNVLTNDTGSGSPAGTLTLNNFTVAGVSGTFTAGQTASIPNVGTIQITSTGDYTFTPVANYNGTVPVISYTATDTNGGSDIGDLRISITPVNDAPVAVDDVKSTNENTAVSGNVLTDGTDDSDVDGNTLTITQFKINGVTYNPGDTANVPGKGTITMNADGSYTFTPIAGYTGAVPVLEYTLSDGNGGSDTGSLAITVVNVNDAPLATDDIVRTTQYVAISGNVKTNDADVDPGTTLTITQFSLSNGGSNVTYTTGSGVITITAANSSAIGTISIGTDGAFTFTPSGTFTGAVPKITYTLSDGTLTDTALLDIFVDPTNTNPLANNDTKTTLEDTPATGNVLTDGTPDSDPDSNVLVVTQYSFTVSGVTYTYPAGSTNVIPGVGTVVVNANGTYTFTPFPDYNGTVPAITYTISDGNGGTATANLSITVTAVNDNPIAVNDDNKTTPEDTPVTVNVLTNDSDIDGNTTLRVTQFIIGGVTTAVDPTTGGTYVIPNKGTVSVLATGELTFTPVANFNGVVPTITYTVTDGTATATANVIITVTPVNDPPTVVNETRSTLENTAITGNVLTDGTDDSDVDGNTLSISQFTIGGVTYPAGSIVELAGVGTIIVNADGSYTFTPNQGYFGTVPTLTYTVSDGNGGTTNGTLAITVTPVNDPPVVVNESLSIQEDATASGNLLSNDTDPENNSLTITQFTIAGVSGTFTPGTTAVVIPNVGSIVINANGTYTFTPVANYNGIVPNIEYTVSDGQGAFTNGTLTIVVAAVNDAPTVTNDTKSEPVNTPIVGNVLTNDRDIEGTALSLTKFTIGGVDYAAGTTATIAGVGTVQINADGTYTFTPATNYIGSPPVITYTVSDGTATSTATLSLTITPIDADGDGIPDATEKGTGSTPRDSDNDGTPDYLDTDSDNDGIPDAAEDALCIGFLPCTPTDTDGDGTPDYRDLDSDGDGISDAIEGTTDTDGDGIPNYQDTDSDGDGILDSVEKGPTATPVDTDLDGTPDYRDLDSDGDGIPDATEGTLDTDADGVPNFRDLDSDGDGISDAIEGTTDTDGDGTPNYLDTDSDGDGISDTIEKGPTGTPVDTDGDGTPDYKDLDSDNDGILDSTETATDTDSDGIPNFRDLDSDGDGILDAVEGTVDSDGDGTPNYRDVDSDGDGIPDSIEKGTGSVPVDTDGDGTPDYLDLDTDGDGIPDAVEDAGCTGTAPCTPTDTDGDGTPNFRDLDSDGDGLTDAVEKGPNGATPVDTDGDTTPDYLDVDSDADGISDAIEKGTGTTPLDTDGDGTPDYRDTDSDNDGITDAIEKGSGSTPVDTDNDGTPDYRDLDADGDGKADQSEGNVDTDGDGTPNFRDLDSDGDGVVDAVDACPLVNGLGSSNGCPPDSDGDGLADVDDSDDDNDGILDTVEAAACSPAAATCDTDGDGIPNILDTDSDGDGISDVTEAGGTDADRDGKADGAPDVNGIPASASVGLSPPNTDGTGASNPYDTDSDGDGILDAIEKGTGVTLADTDNDNIPDYLDTDSDGDGISDAIEKGSGTAVADTDGDGIPDFRDLDSDGDGIPDAIEKGSGSTPVDTDGDGIPNFRDVDSDGDGILDSVEDAACSGTTPCTPTDTDGDNTPDYLDVDSDADGIPDAIEGTVDTDRDGLPDYLDTDSDGDGIVDSVEDAGCTGTMPCTPTDTDGDGIPNFRDLDSDGDGITDAIEGTTDIDGDSIPNYLDPDSDGDGISDAIEGNVDSDGDGTPNYKDLDSDGDNIPDAIEKGTTTAPVDTDSDGTPDYLDTDTDGDGIPDAVEDSGCALNATTCTPTDTDGDGIPNHKDLDSDNDGIPDSVEKGIDGANPDNTDGTDTPNYLDADSDNDGISDAIERGINGNSPLDTDGDGTPDYKEVDSDGDGISDAIEGTVDTDGDGIPNYRDTDSDNDGILDSVEKGSGSTPVDTDNDGTPDYKDLDSDGDNKSDLSEGISDFDGDGTPNYLDLDSDADGVNDNVDMCPLLFGTHDRGCPVDTDADGIYDTDDLDDDNDGLLDTVEAAACSPVAADCDTDGDGIPNRIDPDADNDGINDVRESNGTDVDGDGKVDGTVDADGVPSSTNGGLTPPNTDGTTLPDPYDTDSDGDGISDSLERGPNPNAPVDTDGDGIPDYRDADSDNDGIPDSVERGTGAAILDTDGDGTPDYKDLDSDNDGITDAVEKGPSGATPLDTDGDGIPNYRDLDSDGDGIPDSIEKGTGSTLLNTDGDLIPDYLDTDSDGDGISDAIEKGLNGNSPIDTDGDGIPDYRDTDSDNDGIPDSVEKGTGSTPIDTDGDGVPNYRDLDSDGDGITDAVEKGANGAIPVDTDSDGSPDYVDLDADGDGKLDAIEKGTGTTLLDTDRDGIPDYRDVDNYGQPDVNVTDVSVPVVGNVKTNDAVPAGTTYGQPAAIAGATLVMDPATGTYTFTSATPGKYVYLIPVCGPNQTSNCPLTPLQITVLDPLAVDKPVANTDFAILEQGGSATVAILANDKAGDLGKTIDATSLVVLTAPAHGTAVVNSDGTITYTPSPFFVGVDSLEYRICDTNNPAQCQTATVYFTVEPAGLVVKTGAVDDFAIVRASPDGTANVTGNVLSNDLNGTGATLTANLVTGPTSAQGTFTLNANGTYSFTPAAGFSGPVEIIYEACGGSPVVCTKATLHILVEPMPTLVNDTNTAFANVPKAGDISTNDTKPAGTTYGQPAQQTGATLTVNADGTYSFTATAAGTYTYTVPVCAPGQVGTCPTQTLTLTVTAPSPVNDTNTAFANVPKTGDLSTNDTNPAGSTYGQPAQQTGATLTVNADGTYSFTATAAGTYTYTVPVCAPGQTTNCPTQTLTITVTAPSLVNDTDTTFANVPKTGNLSTNDTNPAGSTYGQPAQQAGATLTVNADGTYSFTATAAGTYTYTVPVCAPGQTTNCPTQTLTITVTAPSLVNDTATALANVPKTGNLSTNDTNPAGSTYGQPSQQTGATLTVNADGTYSFTATAAGTYTYTVPVCAPGQTTNCPTQTLTITVTAPSLVNDTDTALAYVPKTGNLSTNDTNPAGSTYGQPAQQAGATLTVNTDGTYSFTATAAGTYTYTVPVCAPGQTANCPTQTLTITVTAPSLVNDTNTALANVPKTGNLSTNDTNPAGSTYGQPAQQAGATLTVNADGTYSFTATAAGTYTYIVSVCAPGQTSNCPTQTLTITVAAPSPVNDTNTAFANVPKAGDLSTNDTNPVGSTYGQPAQQAGATLTVNADGTYSFTATAAGTYTYTVPVCAPGQTANCPTQTLTITVTAPSPVNDTDTALANVPKSGNLSTNDTNPAGSTYGQPAQQAGATLTVNADGTYSFTATAAGTYTYTVPVCAPGQTANCPTQTLTITVTGNELSAGLDNFQEREINGLVGGIVGNVLTNDLLGGKPVIASQVVISVKDNGGLTGVVIDKEGNLILPAGVAPGSYVVVYTICDVLNPTNCKEAMAIVEVFLPVDLKVTKLVEAPEWFEGDEFTYTLRVENTGKTAATSVVVTDKLPIGLRYVSLVSSQIPVNTQVRGQEITFNITQLPIAGATDIRLKVKAAPLADGKDISLLNTVSVTSKGREMSPADNTSSVPVRLKAFFIPNTITPNGGGVNDTFEIPGLGRYVSNELVIMNRWGDQVFERKNYQNDWGAEGLVSGTYFYILKVTDEEGRENSFKGFIEVVKERVR